MTKRAAQELADRIAKLPAYDGQFLRCRLYQFGLDPREATETPTVILIDERHRDIIVAALRSDGDSQ